VWWSIKQKGNVMRTIFLATIAILPLLAGFPAIAADMPAKAPAYGQAPPVPYSWTGMYFGGHLGAGWATSEWRNRDFGGQFGPFSMGSGTASGFLGGAQIGANYQVDVMVFGAEADFSWADLSGQTCTTLAALVQCNSRVDRFGTVAGRFGIAADRALLYFKGGAAWAHGSHDLTAFGTGINPPPENTVSANKWGWTAGAGVEYALTRNWSAKLEYDFMDFGTTRFGFDLTPNAVVTADIRQRIQVVKLGWNYEFDWSGPVAASH
jgi:outer membrane immunogenic protein